MARRGASIALVGMLAVAGACSSSSSTHKYPKGVEQTYIKGCEQNRKDQSTCACFVHALEKAVSYDDWQRLAKKAVAGDKAVIRQLGAIGKGCNR